MHPATDWATKTLPACHRPRAAVGLGGVVQARCSLRANASGLLKHNLCYRGRRHAAPRDATRRQQPGANADRVKR